MCMKFLILSSLLEKDIKLWRKYHGCGEEYNKEKREMGKQYHLPHNIWEENKGRERNFWEENKDLKKNEMDMEL